MILVANKECYVATDGIGVKSAHIQVGEIDCEKLGITPSAIEWLLKEGLADYIGEEDAETVTEDSAETIVETAVEFEEESIEDIIADELEEESTVSFNIEINPIEVIETIEDKKELEIYAREFGIELDKRKKIENMRKEFRAEYKPTIETK